MSRKNVLSASLMLITLLQCFAVQSHAAVNDERLEVKASEIEKLRSLLNNQKVEAVFTDGNILKGRVKEVKDGTVVINVDSSKGAAALPRGLQDIAIDRVGTIEINSFKGKKRGILAAVFGAAGLALGVAIGSMEIDTLGGEGSINGAGAAVIAVTTAGGAAAGYALGRHLDKKRVTIVIVK